MSKWHQVGTIRMSESKDDGTPGKLYIKFHQNKEKDGWSSDGLNALSSAIKSAGQKGVSLQIEKPQDKILRMAALGFIDEDKVEGRLESVPDYIKYEITLPPQD